jgi:hypothetical protein
MNEWWGNNYFGLKKRCFVEALSSENKMAGKIFAIGQSHR